MQAMSNYNTRLSQGMGETLYGVSLRDMKVLDKDEKKIYNTMMSMIKVKKLRCWNHTAPDDFENHTPEEFK